MGTSPWTLSTGLVAWNRWAQQRNTCKTLARVYKKWKSSKFIAEQLATHKLEKAPKRRSDSQELDRDTETKWEVTDTGSHRRRQRWELVHIRRSNPCLSFPAGKCKTGLTFGRELPCVKYVAYVPVSRHTSIENFITINLVLIMFPLSTFLLAKNLRNKILLC